MPSTLNNREPTHTFCDKVPDPPASLKEIGKERWNEFCGYMFDNGNLAHLFLPTIERVCMLYDKMDYLEKRYFTAQEAHNLIQNQGKRTNPIFKMWLLCDTQIAKYLETLGMSPKSRKNGNLPVAGNGGNPMSNRTKQGQGVRPKNIDRGIAFPISKTG